MIRFLQYYSGNIYQQLTSYSFLKSNGHDFYGYKVRMFNGGLNSLELYFMPNKYIYNITQHNYQMLSCIHIQVVKQIILIFLVLGLVMIQIDKFNHSVEIKFNLTLNTKFGKKHNPLSRLVTTDSLDQFQSQTSCSGQIFFTFLYFHFPIKSATMISTIILERGDSNPKYFHYWCGLHMHLI